MVSEYKLACEASICGIIYKSPETIYGLNLKLSDFSHNVWKVYFSIAEGILITEKKKSLDDITIGLYLEKHLKLRDKYSEYGGYKTITNAGEYVVVENLSGYIKDLHKWNSVIALAKRGFPIKDRISEFCDMSADEIYNEHEALLNDIFVNIENDIKSYNAFDGIHSLIDKLNKGERIGLPLHNAEITNVETCGLNLGNIYGLGALSGVGKSTTVINWIIPSLIDHNEQAVFIINEEDESKIRTEMIIWVANNVFKEKLQKHTLNAGGFNEEDLKLMRKCADWIEEKKGNRTITIIPLESYSVDIAIRIIRKYSAMGVKYFVLDTLKEDVNSVSDQIWLQMKRDMVKLYDVIKPSVKNVCLFVTYQLGNSAIRQRYYTNYEVGSSKGIVEVMSVNIMMRRPLDDEFSSGKREITCYRLEGKNKRTKIPFKLNKDKRYVIVFLPKNRFGMTGEYQIVAEYDLSVNTYKEVGICMIAQDW